MRIGKNMRCQLEWRNTSEGYVEARGRTQSNVPNPQKGARRKRALIQATRGINPTTTKEAPDKDNEEGKGIFFGLPYIMKY